MNAHEIGLSLLLGLSVSGFVTGCQNKAASDTSATASAPAASKVTVTVNEDGFVPNAITAKKGEPLTLEFKRVSDKTCATAVAFPELNLTKELPLNTPVSVEIPTAQARTLAFQCGMGMYKSSVVIQ